MRKIIFYLFFLLIPVVNNARVPEGKSTGALNEDIYATISLAETGLARDVFDLAINGLNKLSTEGKLINSTIVTIADYSQSSNKKRLYVIDLKDRKLLFNTYVAHGKNTGDEYARFYVVIQLLGALFFNLIFNFLIP